MSALPAISRGISRFLFILLVLLGWMLAAALGLMLSGCGGEDALGLVILTVAFVGIVVWPLTLLVLIGLAVLAIRWRPFRDGAAGRTLATAAGIGFAIALLSAAGTLGSAGSCRISFGF